MRIGIRTSWPKPAHGAAYGVVSLQIRSLLPAVERAHASLMHPLDRTAFLHPTSDSPSFDERRIIRLTSPCNRIPGHPVSAYFYDSGTPKAAGGSLKTQRSGVLGTVAITYPFLMPYIQTADGVNLGLETLAFAGLVFGLTISPIHLCLALSASYFEAPLTRIILKVLPPALCIAAAGLAIALVTP